MEWVEYSGENWIGCIMHVGISDLQKGVSMYRKSRYRTNGDVRAEYSGSRRFDKSCWNGGSCKWCNGDRLYQRRRAEGAARVEVEEWEMWEGEGEGKGEELGGWLDLWEYESEDDFWGAMDDWDDWLSEKYGWD